MNKNNYFKPYKLIAMKKFSDINLIGFAYFALNVQHLFNDFDVEYVSISASNHIEIQEKDAMMKEEGSFEIHLYNPTGGEETFDTAKAAIESYNSSIEVGFYCSTLDGDISVNVPLNLFDDNDFINILKSWIGKRPLVPYNEEDSDILYNHSRDWFLKEVEISGLTKYINMSKFQNQFKK